MALVGTINASNDFGLKNRIINGAMQVWQRATTATNVTLNGPGYTTVDRFFVYQNGSVGVQTSQVAASLSGFQYAIKWGRPNTNTSTGVTVFGQTLETANSVDLQGQSVTLSFWAKCGANFSAASSQITVQVYTGTGTDQSSTLMVSGSWTGSATPVNTTATLTTSWQRFTFTGTFGASVTQAGIYFNWTPVGTAGADDNVYITGVQLEKSSTATSFDYRDYGRELQMCKRYYEYLPALYYRTYIPNNTTARMYTLWNVTKRAAPTITVYATANGQAGYITASGANYAVAGAVNNDGISYCWESVSIASGSTNMDIGFNIKGEAEL